MDINEITIPYCRPVKLSDPYKDFSQEELNGIISTPDNSLGFFEFSCIFQNSVPAGTYEESAYFIPLALKYIKKNKHDSVDVADYFLSWISYNYDELRHDCLWNKITIFFEEIFHCITTIFKLHRYPDNYLAPEKYNMLSTLLERLNFNSVSDNIADVWLKKYLVDYSSYNTAAWILYLVNEHYQLPNIWNSNIVDSWIENQGVLKKSRDTIVNNIDNMDSITLNFWSEKLIEIGL